jgi:hypothetical protein
MAVSNWFDFGKKIVGYFKKAKPNIEKRPAGENPTPKFEDYASKNKKNIKVS